MKDEMQQSNKTNESKTKEVEPIAKKVEPFKPQDQNTKKVVEPVFKSGNKLPAV